MDLHQCPHQGCDVQIRSGLFACNRHWNELPREIQRNIKQAWYDILEGGPTALDAHHAASVAARSYWEGP